MSDRGGGGKNWIDVDLHDADYPFERREAEKEIYAGRNLKIVRLTEPGLPFTVVALVPQGEVAAHLTSLGSTHAFRSDVAAVGRRHAESLQLLNRNLRTVGALPDIHEEP